MSNTNNRPEWAQGPEWEGWRNHDKWTMVRSDKDSVVWIKRGFVGNRRAFLVNDLAVNTLKTALAIANLIAEDRGGWAE